MQLNKQFTGGAHSRCVVMEDSQHLRELTSEFKSRRHPPINLMTIAAFHLRCDGRQYGENDDTTTIK